MTRRVRNPRRRTLRGGAKFANVDDACKRISAAPINKVRKLYLEASRQFHPDKIIVQSEAEKDAVTKDFQKLSQCYEKRVPSGDFVADEPPVVPPRGPAPAAAAGPRPAAAAAAAAAAPRAPAAAAAAAAAAAPRAPAAAAAAAAPPRPAAAEAAAAERRRQRAEDEQDRKDAAVRERAERIYAERQRMQREAQAAAQPMQAADGERAQREREARRAVLAAEAQAQLAFEARVRAEREAERMRIRENVEAERARNEMLSDAERRHAIAQAQAAEAQRVRIEARVRELDAAEQEIWQREHAARIELAQYAAAAEQERGRPGPFGYFKKNPEPRGKFSPYGGGATRRSSLPRLLAMRSSSATRRTYSRRRRA